MPLAVRRQIKKHYDIQGHPAKKSGFQKSIMTFKKKLAMSYSFVFEIAYVVLVFVWACENRIQSMIKLGYVPYTKKPQKSTIITKAKPLTHIQNNSREIRLFSNYKKKNEL